MLVLPGLVAPAPAFAQTVISTSQVVPIDLAPFGGVVVGAGVSLSGTGLAELWDLSATNVSNQGVISDTLGVGVLLSGGGSVSNAGLVRGNEALVLGAGGVVENAGSLAGALYGVRVSGGAGAVGNGGTIAAGFVGVALGAGGSVGNSGVISGGALGVYTAGGTGRVVNAGTITGGSGDGVSLFTGGSVENLAGGVLAGGYAGVYAGGTGALVANAGVISGTAFGSYFTGASSLSNAGTLTGGLVGAMALGSGAVLGNSGVIAGGNTGARVAGTASVIENTGTITGRVTGVRLARNDTLTNAGVIAGGQMGVVAGGGDVIVDTGTISAGNGGAAVSFGNGGGTASQIELGGSGVLDAPIAGFGAGSALTVNPGAAWTGEGTWSIGQVVNDGVFTPGLMGNALVLNGNFAQASAGVLKVYVTPGGIAPFVVHGTAQLGGVLEYMLAPGTYEPATDAFLTADGGVSGAFAAVNGLSGGANGVAVSADAVLLAQHASLVLNENFAVTPGGTALFRDVGLMASDAAWQADEAVLARAGAPGPQGCVAAAPQDASTAAGVAAALARGICAAGGWVEARGDVLGLEGGFNAAGGGFLAGIDRPVAGARVGVAVGYDAEELTAKGGQSATLGNFRFGAYVSQAMGAFVVSGDVLETLESLATTRATGAGAAVAKANGNVFSAGLLVSVPLNYGAWDVVPALGLEVQDVTSGRLDEQAATQAFAVNVAGANGGSMLPYARVTLARSFTLGNGMVVQPSLKLGVSGRLGTVGEGMAVRAQDGTLFGVAGRGLDPVAGEAGLGLKIGRGAWAFEAGYDARLSGNWAAQSLYGAIVLRF